MKRPVGITVLSVLAFIGGAFMLLSSLGYLGITTLQTTLLAGVITGMSPAMVLGTGWLSLIAGVASIAFGVGALSLKSWAWPMGIVVWGGSLILSVVQLAVAGIALIPVLSAIVAVAILGYLASSSVREVFHVEIGSHSTTHHPSAV